MKADTLTLTQLFNHPICFEVPLYQRPYVWEEEKHWAPLWEDIRFTAERLLAEQEALGDGAADASRAEEFTSPHFLGAIVVEHLPSGTGMIELRSIIDGQQRLMTLQLFLDAAHDVAMEYGDERARLFAMLTENDPDLMRAPRDMYKVWPSKFDRDAFKLTMDRDSVSDRDDFDPSKTKIWQAHEFFCASLRDWLGESSGETEGRLDALRTTLWRLVRLVVIDLDQHDNAQVIFETLNARGTPLLASDLIKNTMFMQAAALGRSLDPLYESYWKPLDEDWWREEISQGRLKRPRLDIFFFHWLTMRLDTEIALHDVFPQFKRLLADHTPEPMLADISLHSKTYRSFDSLPKGSIEGTFFDRLEAMETATATPLLLFVLAHRDESISLEQKYLMMRAIESWLARRLMCRMTTKNYNQVFLALLSAVQVDPVHAGDVTTAFLRGLSGESQAWPGDEEVLASLLSLPIYRLISRGRLGMLLKAMENELRTGMADEAAVGGRVNIEHILPQSWEANWPLPNGVDQEEATSRRDALKHTLGNLTLVNGKLNSRLSNDPWIEKHETLREHITLFLNKDVVNRYEVRWDEEAILERGRSLAKIALRIWAGPNSKAWPADDAGSGDADRFMREHGELLSASGADVAAGGPTPAGGAFSHEEISATVHTELLQEVLITFDSWLADHGVLVKHMKGSHHSLYAGKRWIGGYYFATKWLHFWLRERLPSDHSLQDLSNPRSLSLKERSVVGNVAEDEDLELLKGAILQRVEP